MRIRHPMNLRHPVLWLIGCLIHIGHFPQKSLIISGSFAKNDLQLKATYGSSAPCTMTHQSIRAAAAAPFVSNVLQFVEVCCSACVAVRWGVLQCVAACCSVLQCVAVCLAHCNTHSFSHATDATQSVYSLLQCVEMRHCNTRQHTATHCNTLHVCWDAPQCVEVCCSVLQCVAVYPQVLRKKITLPPPSPHHAQSLSLPPFF